MTLSVEQKQQLASKKGKNNREITPRGFFATRIVAVASVSRRQMANNAIAERFQHLEITERAGRLSELQRTVTSLYQISSARPKRSSLAAEISE